MTTAPPEAGPEVLTDGPRRATRRSRLVLLVVVLALAGLVGGPLLWRLRPIPPPTFTLSALQGVYAGMVRSDGTSDASVIDPSRVHSEVGMVDPSDCTALFDATVLNRPPQGALDGVGTFWQLDRSAISMFSYRFADVASAEQLLTLLQRVLDECSHTPVRIDGGLPISGDLTVVPPAAAQPQRRELGYVVTSDAGVKVAIHVFALSNTVSWQYRYEPTPGDYDPIGAQRVMESLAVQMVAVLALSSGAGTGRR